MSEQPVPAAVGSSAELGHAVSERGWLVEWRYNGLQWLYLINCTFRFTSDPAKALRLARREDAEAVMAWAAECDRRLGLRPIGALLVTEHEWPNDELTGRPLGGSN